MQNSALVADNFEYTPHKK